MIVDNQKSTPRKKRPFLVYMHYFRAWAIINVVFIHVWRSSLCTSPEVERNVYILSHTVFANSTIYFIFISGFLFYYLSVNFTVIRYYKGKFLNVILPYLLISVLFLVVQSVNRGEMLSLREYAYLLVTGKAQFPYWYIPFVTLIFAVSPLFLKVNDSLFRRITLLSCVLPLFGTRTGTEITVGQYLYLMPSYLLGILLAKDIEGYMVLLRQYFLLILSVACIASVGVFVLYSHNVQEMRYGMNAIYSVSYIQKIALTFLSILLFKRIEHRQIRILNMLATYSFAIYFLHTLVDLGKVRTYLFCDLFPQLNTGAILLGYGAVILIVTLGLSVLLKRVFGRYSRRLIGA